MIGVRDDATTRMWMRAVGAREIVAGVGIFSRRRPTEWLWARVAGDTMDLALLGSAMRSKSRRPGRTPPPPPPAPSQARSPPTSSTA